jgi:hypothetical protein
MHKRFGLRVIAETLLWCLWCLWCSNGVQTVKKIATFERSEVGLIALLFSTAVVSRSVSVAVSGDEGCSVRSLQ